MTIGGAWSPRALRATGVGLALLCVAPAAADPVDRSAAPVLVAIAGAGDAPSVRAPGDPLAPGLVGGAVSPLLRGGALGRGRTPAHIVDAATGEVLFAQADRPTVPASTVKLVTAVSVLDSLGADATLETRTVLRDPAAAVPRTILVGAGDPSLASTGRRVGADGTSLRPPSLRRLAQSTARALGGRGISRVRVGYDDSLFSGPALHPTWATSFPAAGVVAPVSALQVDQGRATPTGFSRVAEPALRALEVFVEQLEQAGIEVTGRLRRVPPTSQSVPLASVASPSIGVLVERMLATSDNDYAEALARLGALGAGGQGSFEGAAERAAAVVAGLGIEAPKDRYADGSGLSRENALLPSTLTSVLRAARGQFGEVSSGLPVGGATGSLRDRYATTATEAARGVVRAKTGTLTGVIGLAGFVSRPDGRLLVFAFLDDSVTGGAFGARDSMDRAVAALVECDCTRRPDPTAGASGSAIPEPDPDAEPGSG